MKKILYISLPLFALLSCGGSAEEAENESQNENVSNAELVDTTSVDTLALEENRVPIDLDVEQLLAKAKGNYKLPLSIDSIFIADLGQGHNAQSNYNMTNIEAQYLSSNFVKNDLTSMASYNVETFIRLDSLKIKGEYDAYQEQIDIGMARYSVANVVGKVNIDKNRMILIWYTDYATFEACPGGSGTFVFGTLFKNNAAINSALLGEISGGADAPYWGETLITSTITADKINLHKKDANGGDEDPETGEEIVEQSELDYTISITPEGFEENK